MCIKFMLYFSAKWEFCRKVKLLVQCRLFNGNNYQTNLGMKCLVNYLLSKLCFSFFVHGHQGFSTAFQITLLYYCLTPALCLQVKSNLEFWYWFFHFDKNWLKSILNGLMGCLKPTKLNQYRLLMQNHIHIKEQLTFGTKSFVGYHLFVIMYVQCKFDSVTNYCPSLPKLKIKCITKGSCEVA